MVDIYFRALLEGKEPENVTKVTISALMHSQTLQKAREGSTIELDSGMDDQALRLQQVSMPTFSEPKGSSACLIPSRCDSEPDANHPTSQEGRDQL